VKPSTRAIVDQYQARARDIADAHLLRVDRGWKLLAVALADLSDAFEHDGTAHDMLGAMHEVNCRLAGWMLLARESAGG